MEDLLELEEFLELEDGEKLEDLDSTSHNADSKHLRPLICAEEAVGLHKRVKRIHDPVKIVVPYDVVGLASSSSAQPIQGAARFLSAS
ncbi:hypothetical protein HID58_079495 [Brassica napus]|uniref:Uncharacterized protein n=1 Tax=Brassica napus TaxID=3708 RepID=A0ABQ7Y263_BRANA|nr:hypothetical protein HID58_079495 [Brassica napus]